MNQEYEFSPSHCDQLTLEELLPLAEQLPIEDKVALLERLIGKQSGLNVVLEHNQLKESIVKQISTMDREQLSDILQVVATRIASEGQ
jgi:hypothetical protein